MSQVIAPSRFAAIPFLLALSLQGAGSAADCRGVGYLTRRDGVEFYEKDAGDKVVFIARKHFPLIGFDTWSGNGKASESRGRAHVRYYVNAQDSGSGGDTAWVLLADVSKFWFESCGEGSCAGVRMKNGRFGFSECVLQAAADLTTKLASTQGDPTELEKLRLQLEIEKAKLEQERLRTAAPATPTPTPTLTPSPVSTPK